MYKVVFADDEILTREAIAENTPWKEAGFQLVGTAENGRDAIAVIEEQKPELLVTDICMPVMDGLELSGYVQTHYPDMKVMILSGYDEFEYAKKALKYGVSEYILKPITSAELKDELIRIREKLDKDAEKRDRIAGIRREYEENLPLLREHFLERLLNGKIKDDAIYDEMEKMGIRISGSWQAVILIGTPDASDWEKEHPDISASLMNFIFYNVSGELLQNEKNILLFRNISDRCILILARDSEKALLQDAAEIGEMIRSALKKYLNIRTCITVGESVHSPRGWQTSYENAEYAEEFRYLLEDGGVLYGRDFLKGSGVGIQTSSWSEKLVLLIKTGQQDEIRNTAAEFFTVLHSAKCERKTLYLHIQNCVLSILITLEEWETVEEGELSDKAEFINSLDTCRHLSDIQEKFTSFCLECAEIIARKRDSSNQTIAVAAQDYIEKNYRNPDLNLNMLCDYLSLSVSYFSMVFKNSTGETFVEALTRTRIEKAKKILEGTNAKAYEAATQVGYNDPHYFGTTFKKFTGMTPMEYAKQSRAEG